jgi:dipeptidase
LRNWLPNPIGGIIWTGLAAAPTTAHIPMYSGTNETPEAYTIGKQENGEIKVSEFAERGGKYNQKSAYWKFRVISDLVNLFYTATRDEVIPVWREWEDKLFKLQPAVEETAVKLYQEDPDLAVDFITNYSCTKAKEALKMAEEMIGKLHTIIAKHNGVYT